MGQDTDDGAVALQLGKILLDLLLPRFVGPLQRSLRERLLLGPIPAIT